MLKTCLLTTLRRCPNILSRRSFILGIESSCDDSAAAVLSEDGKILGESIVNQHSVRFGGVLPSLAMGMHAKNVPHVVEESLRTAEMDIRDIKYIAVTNRPGLNGSLLIGTRYAVYLSRKYNIPIIPVHHMEAHALTVRMTHKVEFPFMVLLLSGGHCLLAMAKDINKFLLLGNSQDTSPGEVIDKVARSLRLHLLREDLREKSGGQALEIVGDEGGDPRAINFPIPLTHKRNCDFSFSGLKSKFQYQLKMLERQHSLDCDQILPNANDFAASFQFTICQHICHRVQRAIVYSDMEELWDGTDTENPQRHLVVSGGVASNKMIRSSLEKVCKEMECKAVFPPVKYCTDNGVMIAWNGLEKLRRGLDVVHPDRVFDIQVHSRAEFGEDIREDVQKKHIKCKWVSIL